MWLLKKFWTLQIKVATYGQNCKLTSQNGKKPIRKKKLLLKYRKQKLKDR